MSRKGIHHRTCEIRLITLYRAKQFFDRSAVQWRDCSCFSRYSAQRVVMRVIASSVCSEPRTNSGANRPWHNDSRASHSRPRPTCTPIASLPFPLASPGARGNELNEKGMASHFAQGVASASCRTGNAAFQRKRPPCRSALSLGFKFGIPTDTGA